VFNGTRAKGNPAPLPPYNQPMQVWVRKCASFDEDRDADREFWARMTPAERIAAVDELRAQWASMSGHGHEGLRRAVRMLERPPR
jgi:hypothetical protein